MVDVDFKTECLDMAGWLLDKRDSYDEGSTDWAWFDEAADDMLATADRIGKG